MQHHTSCACSVCQDHLRKVVTMQRFLVKDGLLVEDEHGGLVIYVDMLREEIKTARRDKATAEARIRFLRTKLKEQLR